MLLRQLSKLFQRSGGFGCIQGTFKFAKEVVNKVNALINNNSIKEDLFENSKKFKGVDKIQIKNFSFKFKR